MTGTPAFWDRVAGELHNAGVELVIGFPADEPSLTDAADRHPRLTAVVPRDQRMLGCVAAGYSHTSGRTAAIEVSTGPSFMNSLVGLSELASLRHPAVLVTGAIGASRRGRGAFQEIDQRATLGELAVWSGLIDSADQVGRVIDAAAWTARGGGRGIALVEVDQVIASAPGVVPGGRDRRPRTPPVALPGDEALHEAARLLAASERPLIVVGGGAHAARATAQVVELADLLTAAVATTASGRGTVPEDHELFCGLVGLYRTEEAAVVERADLVVVIGSRLEETARYDWPALDEVPVIRLDSDPRAELTGPGSACFLLGDAALGTARLTAELRGTAAAHDRSGWAAEIAETRAALAASVEGGLGPVPSTLRAISRVFGDRPYCVVQENGLHDLWGYHFPVLDLGATGTALTPGEQTMMGFGVPAALGVHLADPGLDLVVTCGDGALEMSFAALATARAWGVGLTVVVWDNGGWGWPRCGRPEARHLATFEETARTLPLLERMFSDVTHPVGPAAVEDALRTAREKARAGQLCLVVIAADDRDLPPCARHAFGEEA